MKKILFSVILLAIFSCNSSTKHSKATYQITDWMAAVPVNLNYFDGGIGWLKMVVYKDSLEDKWKLNSDGDTIHLYKITTDTFYLLRNGDSEFPLKDSTGNIKLDPTTHQPLYHLSYRNATMLPKDIVKPQFPIPSRFLPALYRTLPTHDTTTKLQDTTKAINRKVIK